MGWSAYRKTGLTYHSPNLSVKGFTLFSPVGFNEVYLINMAGQIVHRWSCEDCSPGLARLLPSGNLIVSVTDLDASKRAREADEETLLAHLELHLLRLGGGYTTLREYDWHGNLVWSYDNPSMHHDYCVQETGNMLIPLWVRLPEDVARTVRGGIRSRRRNQPPMVGDDLIEINRDGLELSRWHTWHMFDPRRDPIQPLRNRWEWTHLNSVDVTASGDMVISCRHNSRVAIIDRTARKITWKLSDPEISLQHDASCLPNGNIQIFDNGMNKPMAGPYSRIIEVNPVTSEIEWEYKAQPAEQFYSGHLSGAQRLDRGNVLICEGTSGRLFEVTRKGEVVWEWITPFVSGSPDGNLRTWIYRAYRYPVEHPALEQRDLNPRNFRNLNESLGLTP